MFVFMLIYLFAFYSHDALILVYIRTYVHDYTLTHIHDYVFTCVHICAYINAFILFILKKNYFVKSFTSIFTGAS